MMAAMKICNSNHLVGTMLEQCSSYWLSIFTIRLCWNYVSHRLLPHTDLSTVGVGTASLLLQGMGSFTGKLWLQNYHYSGWTFSWNCTAVRFFLFNSLVVLLLAYVLDVITGCSLSLSSFNFTPLLSSTNVFHHKFLASHIPCWCLFSGDL